MEKYLNDWITVIEGIKNDNTYKASWGKAIIECVLKGEFEDRGDYIIMEEYFIVQKVLKYYWNMNVFFNVNQGDYLVVEKMIKDIQKMYSKRHRKTRVWYNVVETYLKGNQLVFERYIRKLMITVNKNVAFRFLNAGRKKVKLYTLDLQNKQLRFKKDHIDIIQKYSVLLNDLINYKWIMFLEHYNVDKHLAKSIYLIDKKNIKSKKLRSYTEFLGDDL